ncbi:uncharacterized protein LOC143030348 [Oratosquilla oratoria]|uniref:uncharacterized protein LOC143030348 n=1 Tax=Oratosquilla oratoria TaxID=337810 RepID=UPI003F764011
MAPEDKKKTAFSTGQSLWHWNVMPFGLMNVSGVFERLMVRILEASRRSWPGSQKCSPARLRKAGLKLNPKKYTLFKSEVPFLGHVVGREGVRTDSLKVTAVEGWPVSQKASELRSFLGLCTYYRRFAAGFATIAAPLHHLTRKGAAFEWSEECQQAFVALKRALVEAQVPPYPQLEYARMVTESY